MSALAEVLDHTGPMTVVDLRDAVTHDVLRAASTHRACAVRESSVVGETAFYWLYRRLPATSLVANKPTDLLPERDHVVERQVLLDLPPWARYFELFENPADFAWNETFFVGQRHHPRQASLPFQFQVFGRDIAMVGIDYDFSPAGAWTITQPQLVADLRRLFVRLWAQSGPLVLGAPGDDALALVAMLSTGMTDEAAASRIGVSVRTYRRRIHELMHALRVTSRFAAGVEASRRGLTDLADALAAPSPAA